MKRYLSLILALALVFTLCSCHSKNPNETESTETTEPVVTTEAALENTVSTEPEETTEAATEPSTETTEPKGVAGIVVKANVLYVRADAGTGNAIVSKLERGASVTVYEKVLLNNVYWGRIDEGWVSLNYIELISGDLESIPLKDSETAASDHKHNYKATVTQPACTERGYTTYACDCGEKYFDNYTEAISHSWSSWATVKEPTESTIGKARRECSRCFEIEERDLAKLIPNHTHIYTDKVTTAPTCTTKGIRTYTCSCGSMYTESIAVTSHDYKDQLVAPTCRAGGYTEHTCRTCSYSYKDCYTEAAAHDYKDEVVAAACEKAGYTSHTCRNCGHNFTDNTTPATGHSWSDWKTTKEPTVSSTGNQERTCLTCGKKDTGTIAKLDTPTEPTQPSEHTHSYGLYKEVAPTCTTDGYRIRSCSCGATETINSYKPARGHKYSAVSTIVATCTTNGSTTYKCGTCGDTYTDTIPASHTWEHYHEDEVGHWDVRIKCHCGWSCSANDDYITLFGNHHDSVPKEEYNDHSYYDTGTWIVDVPAKDWDVCTVCGATQ